MLVLQRVGATQRQAMALSNICNSAWAKTDLLCPFSNPFEKLFRRAVAAIAILCNGSYLPLTSTLSLTPVSKSIQRPRRQIDYGNTAPLLSAPTRLSSSLAHEVTHAPIHMLATR